MSRGWLLHPFELRTINNSNLVGVESSERGVTFSGHTEEEEERREIAVGGARGAVG
jgi:hypothetical protein